MRVWLRGRVDQVQFRNAANLGGEIVRDAGRICKPEVERVGLPDDRRQVLADRAIRTNGAKTRRILAAVGAAGNEELRAVAELGNIAARSPSGEVPGLEATVDHQIDRTREDHDQRRRWRAFVEREISRRGSEVLAAVRQYSGREGPLPIGICRGGAQL